MTNPARARLLAPAAATLLAAAALAACSSAGSGVPHAGSPVTPVTPLSSSSVPVVPSSSVLSTPSTSPSTHTSAPPSTHASTHTSAPASSHSASYVPPPAGHATAPTSSSPLVVLDPGHNGGNASHPEIIDQQVPMGFGQTKACNTTGTSTNGGFPEYEYNWDLSIAIRDILLDHGVRVAFTHPNDVGVGPCVNERAAYGNRLGASAVVIIHGDGAPSSGQGFHVCTASRRPDGVSDATVADSHSLATDIHNDLAGSSGLVPSTYIGSDGYYPRSDMAGLNLSTRPTTFLELGNMRNSHDAALQTSSSGRARIAAAVAAGILKYLGK